MKAALLYYRMAITYFALFSVNALATAIIAALAGKNWSALNGGEQFIIVMAIIANWTGTIMAFLNKSMTQIQGRPPVLTETTNQKTT